jgi:prepilin-type N-terminal cleavage/methylation domain-containing protein
MLRRHARRRSAFTLLEMILALAIGLVLMIGLYFALDIHLTATTVGRSQIDQALVSRTVLKRFSADVKASLASVTYPTPTSTSKKSANSNNAAATTTTTSGPYPFNLGVQGTADYVTIYITKVPQAATVQTTQMGNDPTAQAIDSDLRRVTYWLVPNGDGTGGLARQEVVFVTNDDQMNALPMGMSDESTYIFAPEVVALAFEYYDGTTWQTSWDGTAVGPDGVTPQGPPVAIAITIRVGRSDAKDPGPDDPSVREFRHVVYLPGSSVNSLDTIPTGNQP